MKINHWPEVQSCFSNISAHKYPSKMVQYSKRTFGCQVFKWDWPQTMWAFNFLKNQTETMVQPLKVFLKGCIMDFAWFLQKLEASMAGVCLIWDLTSKGPFWVLNHFWGIFASWDIWKTTLIFWSIIDFQFKFANF